MDIPPNLILPQDMIDVTDMGPPDPGEPPNGDAENLTWRARKAEHDAFVDGGSEPVVMRMHIVDAKHAMDVEPTRYALAGLKPAPEPEPASTDELDPDGKPATGGTPESGSTPPTPPEPIKLELIPDEPGVTRATEEKPVE